MSNIIKIENDGLNIENARKLNFEGLRKWDMITKVYHILILASNTLNIGVLAYPKVIHESGILIFILFLFLSVLINNLSGKLLIHCSQMA